MSLDEHAYVPFQDTDKALKMLEDTLDGRTVLIQVVSLQNSSGEAIDSTNPLTVSTERIGLLETLNVQRQTLKVLEDIRFHLRIISDEEEEN